MATLPMYSPETLATCSLSPISYLSSPSARTALQPGIVFASTSGSLSSFHNPTWPIASACSPLSSSAMSGPAPAVGAQAEDALRRAPEHRLLLGFVDVGGMDQLLRLEVANGKRHVRAHHDLALARLAGEE